MSRHQLGKLREHEEEVYPEICGKMFETKNVDMRAEMLQFMDEISKKPILGASLQDQKQGDSKSSTTAKKD